jgi:hypothetical protein
MLSPTSESNLSSDFDKVCQGKARHRTQRAALRALDKLGKANSVRAYQCTYCYNWHLGHFRKDNE